MQKVRDSMDVPIWPSAKSGYRSVSWEKSHGRSGKSQHTFQGNGAVDWTCENFIANKKDFLRNIIKLTDYTRIAVYDTFIHCDYKDTTTGERQIFKSGNDSRWIFISHTNEYEDGSI
jgi:hypothetical protein